MTDTTTMGGIVLALIGLITKIWLDSSKNTRKIIEVAEKNAVVNTKLNNSVVANTNMTKETKKALFQSHKDIALLISKALGKNHKKNV